ncbi:MAG: hypothetical protein HFE62_03155 [Firmicutes bacterium]|nr:hypothetical protein [Bacillota bacterium]
MKCQDAELLMMKYLDRELNEFEAESLNKHLTECSTCREAFDIYDSMAVQMDQAEQANAPEGFEAAVMAKVAALEKVYLPYTFWDKFKTRFVGSFALLFCVGAMLLSYREKILEIFSENPNFSEKTKVLAIFAENIASQTYRLTETMSRIFENADRILTSGSTFIAFSIAALCALQVYLVRRRNR